MVQIIATALDVPLRERNALLIAAGFAPLYQETGLELPALRQARKALDLILQRQEPYPAVVMDRHWNIVGSNRAAPRFFSRFIDLAAVNGPVNVIRLMFDPAGLRPFVANWPAVAEALMQRIHREALGGTADEQTRRLLAEVLAYPGVRQRWQQPDLLGEPPAPYLAIQFRKGGLAMNFFSTVTTLGTPQDITLQELRIECFFPADEDTEHRAQLLQSEST
jgi:hypothetical protein